MSPEHAYSSEELLQHFNWTRRLAAVLVGDADRAEDLAQETWLAFLRRPPSPERPLRPWLSRVLRNRLRSEARRREAREDHEGRFAAESEQAIDDRLVERMDQHRRLVEQVMALEAKDRRVLVMYFFDGLSARQIAAREGVPHETVRTRLRRAIVRLRERLELKGGSGWRVALAPLLPASRAGRFATLLGSHGGLALALLVTLAALGGAWWSVQGSSLDTPLRAQAKQLPSLSRGVSAVGTSASDPSTAVAPVRSEPARVATRRFTVVRDSDGTPVPGAVVRFARSQESWEWAAVQPFPFNNMQAAVEELGETASTGEDGVVELPIAGTSFQVSCAKDDLYVLRFVDDGAEPVELRLVQVPPIPVRVQSAAGHPLAGVSVVLQQKEQDARKQEILSGARSGSDGVALLRPWSHGRIAFRPDKRYEVALLAPCAAQPRAGVDPVAPPEEPVVLALPPSGSVRVVLVGDETPDTVDVAMYPVLPMETDPMRSQRADRREDRRLVEATEVLFEHVEVGLEVNVYVYGNGTRKDVTVNHAGPRVAGQEAVVEIPLGLKLSRIEGLLTRSNDGELPQSFDVWSRNLDSGEDTVHRRLTVEADGSFEISLADGAVPPGARCRFSLIADLVAGERLGASFEAFGPARGESTSVGTVQLEQPGLIVAGRVTRPDGRPLEHVRLVLGDLLDREAGVPRWSFINFGDQRSGSDGGFEFRGDLPPGEYALHARSKGGAGRWIPFELAEDDLRVELQDPLRLRGNLRLPPGFPSERLCVSARPVGSETSPGDYWLRTHLAVGITSEGAFEISNLDPGAYEIGVLSGAYSEPLLVLGPVDTAVSGDEPIDALADVDLTALKVIEIKLLPPDGETVEGLVVIGSRKYSTSENVLSLITLQDSVDATVRAHGYRAVELNGLSASTEVTLQPGTPVVVTLPDEFELPEPPAKLFVSLLAEERDRSRPRYLYSQDSLTRTFAESRLLFPSAEVGEERQVTLGAPWAGAYELSWVLYDPAVPGVHGGRGFGVRWKPRGETFEVGEQRVVLLTQPLAEDYQRALDRLRSK